MSILLEFLNEHALGIDFGMLLLIWVVQIIVYPTFHMIEESNFISWHRSYCNAIGIFVLPIMSCQLLEVSSACFEVTCGFGSLGGHLFDLSSLPP